MYAVRVKNMHPGSPSDPSGITAAEAKPRWVYSILKPHRQNSRFQVRLLPPRRSRGAYTQFQNHMVRVTSPPQSWSKAVVCVSTPRMYPRSGNFLVSQHLGSLKTHHRSVGQAVKGKKGKDECCYVFSFLFFLSRRHFCKEKHDSHNTKA